MRISKRFLSLLLALCLLAVVFPSPVLSTCSDSNSTTASATQAPAENTTSSAVAATELSAQDPNSPTTDAEIEKALETYDATIDDPEYQKAYDNYQSSLTEDTGDQIQTLRTNPSNDGTEAHIQTLGISLSNGTDTQLQTLSTSTSPYSGIKYTHTHAKTAYIYDGVDVSKWQSTVNWKKVKADGIEFAFIRCGYTPESSFSLNTDSKFITNLKNAYAAGIRVGIYYYSQATTLTEAKKEAAYVVKLLSPYSKMISMPVAMDYERSAARKSRNRNVSKADTTKFAKAFCSVIAAAGYDASYYSSKSELTSYFTQSSLSDYTCWMAHVTSKTNYTGTYDFWQYTFTGDVNGIPTDVDCNFWYTDDTVKPASITSSALTSSNTTVKLSYTTTPYSGSAKKPTPTVAYRGTTLKKGTDYTVTYSNNKEPGTAAVKITGCGKYTGTLSKTFTITALTTPYITSVKTYYRTGCGTSYTSKGSIAKGQPVNVVYGWYQTVRGNKWYKVKIGSKYYYMYGPNLTLEVLVKYASTTKLKYRTGTGTNYTVKGTFATGGAVQVVKGWNKTVNGEKWYKVKVGNSYYYAMAKYLKRQEILVMYAVNATVNVRTGAGITYTRKASLSAGTPVAVVSGGTKTVRGKSWHHVKIGTNYYYIMASYLSEK